MKKEIYITDREKEKCRRVRDAFAELYELTDIVVVDAGRYGFVKLQYYKLAAGVDSAVTYTDSRKLFDDLWDDWLYVQLLTMVKGTPVEELGYGEIFICLTKEKQEELMEKRIYFEMRSEGKLE